MFGYFVFVSVSYLGCSGLDVNTSTSVLLDNVWMEMRCYTAHSSPKSLTGVGSKVAVCQVWWP